MKSNEEKKNAVFQLLIGVLMLLTGILTIIAAIYGNNKIFIRFCLPLGLFWYLILLGYLGSRIKNKEEKKEEEK